MSTSKTENEKGNWLDFETIKANANVTAVLTYYGLIGEHKKAGGIYK